MKNNLIKKLVFKKTTVASLNAEQLEVLRGGNCDAGPSALGCGGSGGCGGGGSDNCTNGSGLFPNSRK